MKETTEDTRSQKQKRVACVQNQVHLAKKYIYRDS